jgi:hypothetical protein
MTDDQKIAAVEDLMDGFSVDRGAQLRQVAAETGIELTKVQKVIKYVESKPIEWQERLRRELEQRQKP